MILGDCGLGVTSANVGAGEVRGGCGRNPADVGSKTLNGGFGVAWDVANTEGNKGPITGFRGGRTVGGA